MGASFSHVKHASYNNLVEKYLPNAAIVYDRYHMQAQYGKDVLGVVRLTEARKHKEAGCMWTR
uniref:transposase n=1 Tax=Candidatus Ventrimonas sp. TaxID=3048889 RepID=UPI003FEE7BCE